MEDSRATHKTTSRQAEKKGQKVVRTEDLPRAEPINSRFRSLNTRFSSWTEFNSDCTTARALASARLTAASLSRANSRAGLTKGINFLKNLFLAWTRLSKF